MFDNNDMLNGLVENNTVEDSIDSKIKAYEHEKATIEKKLQDLNIQQKVLENELGKLEQSIRTELKLDDSIELTDDILDKLKSKIEDNIKNLESQLKD